MIFPSSLFTWLLPALFSLEVLAGAQLQPRQATECNGSPALCERSYGSVTIVGAHNSYAVGQTTNVFVNQDQDVTQQLNDGIRMLQMQAHERDGTIQLCHSSCTFLNGGTLEDYLQTVKTWMDANPNNVVTLLIVNIDNMPAASYDAVFKAVGLDTRSYVPPSTPLPAGSWPTLGEMITQQTNLVTFLDNGADAAIPYLLDEFSNVWETAFNVVDATFLSSDCSVNRTNGDTSTQLYLINHFLNQVILNQPAPFPDRANVTNSAAGEGSLGLHVESCTSINGRPPNFLLVDFYEFGGGSVFQIAADINGIEYNPTTPVASPSPTNSGGASSPSVTSDPNSGLSLPSIALESWYLSLFSLLFGVMF